MNNSIDNISDFEGNHTSHTIGNSFINKDTIGLINMEGTPQEQLKQFLEPYTKEEIENLLLSYCEENNNALDSLMKKIKTDKKWCKLFVHGLAFTTNNEALEKYYEKFGKVKEAVVLVDKKGNSRGYGFVTFSNADEALNAVRAFNSSDVEKKKIDNRITHCNLAWKGNPKKGWSTGPSNQPLSVQARQEANDRRLFVHSLAWKTDDESLRNAFREFGELVEAVVIRDKKTGKSKGYGFVTFKHPESARAALQNPIKTIDGRKTRCNYASTRDTKLYSDSDSNGGTPEPVDLTGSNAGQSTPNHNNGDINPQLMSNMNRGGGPLTPNTTQQPFNMNSVAGLNGITQHMFPQDPFPSMDMYNRNNHNTSRPTLTNFGSNISTSSIGGFNPGFFNMTSAGGPNPTLVLGNSFSNGFTSMNSPNKINNNNNITSNNMQNQNASNVLNGMNMNMMNMQMNMNNAGVPLTSNKPQGIIVHSSNNILPPNTPPMYAHLSSPVKAPSVSSVQSLLTPAPVPLVSFNNRFFNN